MISGKDLYNKKYENFIFNEDEKKLIDSIKNHESWYDVRFVQTEKSKIIYSVIIVFYTLLILGLPYYYTPFDDVWNAVHYIMMVIVVFYVLFSFMIDYKYSGLSSYTIKLIRVNRGNRDTEDTKNTKKENI